MKRIYRARMQVGDEMMFHVLFCCTNPRKILALLLFLLVERIDLFLDKEPYASSKPPTFLPCGHDTRQTQHPVVSASLSASDADLDVFAHEWMTLECSAKLNYTRKEAAGIIDLALRYERGEFVELM